MSNMEDYMIDAVARSLKAKHESELSIEEGKWLDWYERTYASDTSEDEEEELFDCPILLKGNEMNEEQQRQCREAFKAENYVITAVDLFGNGDLFDFVNIYRDGFAAGLAAARGEAVVLNVSAWGNDDKTYVSTTKKHPSGDIEVTTSEASPPPQPASEPIGKELSNLINDLRMQAEDIYSNYGPNADCYPVAVLMSRAADVIAQLIQAEGK